VKIETWEQRDNAADMVPCRADRYAGPHGEWFACGTWCSECEAERYCWRCKAIVEAIKAFDDEQIEERRRLRSESSVTLCTAGVHDTANAKPHQEHLDSGQSIATTE